MSVWAKLLRPIQASVQDDEDDETVLPSGFATTMRGNTGIPGYPDSPGESDHSGSPGSAGGARAPRENLAIKRLAAFR